EDALAGIEIVRDDRAVLKFKIQGCYNELRRDLEKLLRQRHELLFGGTTMPVLHCLGERGRYPSPHADHRGLFAAQLCRNLGSGAEANAPDVASQPVRIFRDHSDGVGTVRLVDAHRPRRAYAVAVQEQHDLADDLLLAPPGNDPLGAFRSNAGYFTKP